MTVKKCKDCPPESKRPAPHPGPRCATHHRMYRKVQKERAHDLSVGRVYGLAPGEYTRLYEEQGGRCYICHLATGKTKRLAVDHDHRTGKVRGLLCSPCNRYIGWIRDDPLAFLRGYEYLTRE